MAPMTKATGQGHLCGRPLERRCVSIMPRQLTEGRPDYPGVVEQ
jgi:hypothetical protein